MDSEIREIVGALLEGQRVAEAERQADRALLKGIIVKLDEHSAEFKAVNAKLDEHSAKLDQHSAEFTAVNAKLSELGADVIGLTKQVGELSARDRHFMYKLGEHDTEIAVLKQQIKAQ